MVDLYVLEHLSNGLTIGDGVYYVAWDSGKEAAVIFVSPKEPDDPLDTLILDLVGDDGEPLEFPSELKAHAFLLDLKEENSDVDLSAY